MTEDSHHPKSGDLYTPVNDSIIALFDAMRARHGSWREVAYLSNTRLKVLRRWRRMEVRAISMTKLDELITTTEVGDLRDYVWFTADDLVALGIWDAPAEPLNASSRRKRTREGNYDDK